MSGHHNVIKFEANAVPTYRVFVPEKRSTSRDPHVAVLACVTYAYNLCLEGCRNVKFGVQVRCSMNIFVGQRSSSLYLTKLMQATCGNW